MLLLFWNCDWLLLEHYFEQGITVTATSCTEIVKSRLKPEICNKCRSLLCKEFLLLHNNMHLHSSAATSEVIRQLQFEFLPHPLAPYSPDLAPLDYHKFGLLKEAL